MKIIRPPDEPPTPTTKFEDGHLYRRAPRGHYYYCACGFLIDPVAGREMQNITQMDIDPAKYHDVTDEFALVHVDLLEKST